LIVILYIILCASFAFSGARKEKEVTEKVHLLFWDFGNYDLSPLEQSLAKDESEWYINEAIARFEAANPNIEVEYFEQEGDKSTELMTATGMAGKGPDVVSLWGGQYVLNIKDVLLPLNDYFSKEEMAKNQGWEFHMEEGNYYGVPINGQITAIFINTSLFDQIGVDPNEYDRTYDGLVQLCEKIKSAGIVPLSMEVADGWGLSFLEGSLYSSQVKDAVSEFKDIAAGKGNYSDNRELVSAFKAVQNLYLKGFFNDDVATITQSEGLTKFANREAAMYTTGNWDLPSLEDVIGDDLGVLPMPSMSADSVNFGTAIGGLGSDALCATSYSEHPKEAIRLIKFLRSYEEDRYRLEKTGNLPTIKGDYSDIAISPILVELTELTDNVTFFLDNLLPGDTADKWFSFEALMLTNQMSVEEFLKEWDISRDEALMAK
jgi:raffinose/stachyose/melibiose transport system substrate-binding protein